jgi:peptide/nickel transport system substrate-binding protein
MSRLRSLTPFRSTRRILVAGSMLACITGAVATTQGSAATSKPSGHLVVLTSAIGATISPTNGTTTQTPTADVYDTLLWFPGAVQKNGLLEYNYKKFVGELATGYTHKGDVYTFTLRQGVKSCAGNTFTSADVIYSIARAKASPDKNGEPTAAAAAYNTAGVFSPSVLASSATPAEKALDGEVKADGPYKVEIVAKNDNGLLPAEITQFPTSIFDATAAKAHATKSDPWSTAWLASHAAGFGPYCLSSWSPTAEQFTLTANKNYFYEPGFDQILVRGVSTPSNELAALESGDADVVDSLTGAEYAAAAHASHVNVLSDFGSTLNLIMPLNESVPPFVGPSGVLVRRAIAETLPYASIIKNAEGGQGLSFPGFIPATIPGAIQYPATFKTDIANAKQLLAQAGYPGGTGLPASGLELYYPAESSAQDEPIAIAIKSALAQIGMNIQLEPIPATQFDTLQFGPNKTMPMSLELAGTGLYNALYYIQSWYLPAADGGFIGVGNYNDAAVNVAYSAASHTGNVAVQAAEIKIAQLALDQTVPVIPISRLPLNAAMRSDIRGVVVSGPGLMYLGHVTRT